MRRGLLEDASFNQSPVLEDVNVFAADQTMVDAAHFYGLDAAALSACGRDYGAAETLELGRLANEQPPKLRVFNAKGDRLDRVDFHPAYHAMMEKSIGYGLHASVHDGSEPHAPMTQRAARLYLAVQAEAGHLCPVTMTHACVGSLKTDPDVLEEWRPLLLTRVYDPAQKPWWEKAGVTIGMGMTERQGGTDVRANISFAQSQGDHVEITGHKWFMSAPMCDAFLVLAQAEAGLTCYLMPRFRPDGSVNGLRFQRLKDKLGNKSNASSEVEFHSAYARRLGPDGAGVRTIIEMVQLTRIDCAVSSAGLMRGALSNAIHHIRHRSVFQRRLADQPSMRAVAADLALELEAQTALAMRLAYAADRSDAPAQAAWSRLLTPAIKYFICKSAPQFVYESLECQGGNGYSEELPLARHFRESPLNAIWEGSGNVMALDILRAAARAPEAARATLAALTAQASEAGPVAPLAAEIERLMFSGDAERRARFICEGLARLAAIATLVETRSPFATLYARTRLAGAGMTQYGAHDLGRAAETTLMERALAH